MSDHPFNVEKYHEGIELFNDVEFFEAHDAWEELWQEYLSLIHISDPTRPRGI